MTWMSVMMIIVICETRSLIAAFLLQFETVGTLLLLLGMLGTLLLLSKVFHLGRMVMPPLNHLLLQMIGSLPHLQCFRIHLVRIQGSIMATMTAVILLHSPLLEGLTTAILPLSLLLEVLIIAILLHSPLQEELTMGSHLHSIQAGRLQYVMTNQRFPHTFRDLIPKTLV